MCLQREREWALQRVRARSAACPAEPAHAEATALVWRDCLSAHRPVMEGARAAAVTPGSGRRPWPRLSPVSPRLKGSASAGCPDSETIPLWPWRLALHGLGSDVAVADVVTIG